MNVESRIAPAEIVKIGHPGLRLGARTVPQELFGTLAFYELIEVMRATLAGQGVGLAAPQLAVPLRLLVIEDTDRMLPRTLASTDPHGVGASSGLLERLRLSDL
jgi:peptide deformylase